MTSHILVPLDGSVLAECVLPHVLAIAPSVNARITLLHVVEPSRSKGGGQTIDPLEWHLKKREAGIYLDGIARRLGEANLSVDTVILEGLSADCVIDFANNNDVTLIILSTHGRSGLSGWNVSSVVQKIILRSFKSTLLVRAYKSPKPDLSAIRYNRLFVGLDCSVRAEYVLPFAINLAQSHNAKLVLGMVIRRPEMLGHFPPSEEDAKLVARIVERNHRAAVHYFERLQKQLSLQGVETQSQLVTSDSVTAALHDMVEQDESDLVMLVAHGRSSEGRWPYGSIATSFIAYGATSLMIMQDLSAEEIEKTVAEIAARESKGH
jgi:nucleotide-binding universal stress UspA family protein